MIGRWYDRQGKLIRGTDAQVGSKAWLEAMQRIDKMLTDPEYRIVKQEYTPDKTYWVSTVWLGLDHNFLGGVFPFNTERPLIFETMVFDKRPERQETTTLMPGHLSPSLDMRRYHTVAEARAGHEELLRRFSTIEELGKPHKAGVK